MRAVRRERFQCSEWARKIGVGNGLLKCGPPSHLRGSAATVGKLRRLCRYGGQAAAAAATVSRLQRLCRYGGQATAALPKRWASYSSLAATVDKLQQRCFGCGAIGRSLRVNAGAVLQMRILSLI